MYEIRVELSWLSGYYFFKKNTVRVVVQYFFLLRGEEKIAKKKIENEAEERLIYIYRSFEDAWASG